jgi:hypothetical protein
VVELPLINDTPDARERLLPALSPAEQEGGSRGVGHLELHRKIKLTTGTEASYMVTATYNGDSTYAQSSAQTRSRSSKPMSRGRRQLSPTRGGTERRLPPRLVHAAHLTVTVTVTVFGFDR